MQSPLRRDGAPPNGDGASLAAGGVRAPVPGTVSRSDYRPGEVVAGKYKLVGMIGEGDTSSVWMAKNTALDAEVALKLIGRQHATSRAGETLLREARAAARVDHPSVVRTFDFGTTERGEPFIVMEVLKGESLLTTLRRKGQLDLPRAVQVVLPVIEAVAAVHQHGILHGDLEPANVFLVPTGTEARRVKVLNFGVGLARDEEAEGARATPSVAFVGSKRHMSPERAVGGALDEKSDVWSVCVLLYQLVSGQIPFVASNDAELVTAIHGQPPRPLPDWGIGDAELWHVLERGLSKRPEDRPSLAELGQRLARWAARHGIKTDISGSALSVVWGRAGETRDGDEPLEAAASATGLAPRQRGILVATLTLAVVVLAGVGVITLMTSSSPNKAGTPSASPADPNPPPSVPATDAVPTVEAKPAVSTHPTAPPRAGGAVPGKPTATARAPGTPAASGAAWPPTKPSGTSPAPPPPPPAGAMPVPTQAPF